MKEICISWTFLDIVEVPDEMTDDEIEDLVSELDPPIEWNDREWSFKK